MRVFLGRQCLLGEWRLSNNNRLLSSVCSGPVLIKACLHPLCLVTTAQGLTPSFCLPVSPSSNPIQMELAFVVTGLAKMRFDYFVVSLLVLSFTALFMFTGRTNARTKAVIMSDATTQTDFAPTAAVPPQPATVPVQAAPQPANVPWQAAAPEALNVSWQAVNDGLNECRMRTSASAAKAHLFVVCKQGHFDSNVESDSKSIWRHCTARFAKLFR